MKNIRELLVRREQELSRSLGDSKSELQVEQVADDFDAIQQASQRDLGVINNKRDFDERTEVRLAIARIDSGEYGLCMRCEKPIPPRRLEVIPWANHCVPCQERLMQAEQPKPVFISPTTKGSSTRNWRGQQAQPTDSDGSVWDKVTQQSKYVGGSYPSQVYKSNVPEK